jgi:hypothetical protein
VTEPGDLAPTQELERSYYETAPAEFVDTLVHLAFSKTGSWLGLFETSAIDHDYRPVGWRGDLVLYESTSGALRWHGKLLLFRTIDGSLAKSIALPTPAAICSLARDAHGAIWTTLDDGKLLVISAATITTSTR